MSSSFPNKKGTTTVINAVTFRKDYVQRQYARGGIPVPNTDLPGWAWGIPFFATTDHVAFAPGLNVIFGPNASGKSTLLRLLAPPACCPNAFEGGIPSMTRPYDSADLALDEMPGISDPRERYLTAIYHHVVGRNPRMGRADIAWDGAPVLWQDFRGATSPPRGLYADEDIVKFAAVHGHSSGESAQLLLEGTLRHLEAFSRRYDAAEFRRAIATIPDTGATRGQPSGLTVRRMDQYDLAAGIQQLFESQGRGWRKVRHDALIAWRAYMQTMPIGDRMTALLDEPDAHLSIPAQAELWERLERLSAHVQLIVATHSPFALRASAAITETIPGYADACRSAFTDLARSVR